MRFSIQSGSEGGYVVYDDEATYQDTRGPYSTQRAIFAGDAVHTMDFLKNKMSIQDESTKKMLEAASADPRTPAPISK